MLWHSGTSGTQAPVGIYVHIPFCAAICNYCNFNRGLHDDGLRRRYVDALVADIRGFRRTRTIDGRHDLLRRRHAVAARTRRSSAGIIDACRDTFDLSPDAEITIEANPESSTAEALDGFRAAGANRLSFGVQSFRDEELRRLGRLHSSQTARDAVRLARAAGFDNLSLDLMMWLPGQSTAEWLTSVEALIDQQPDHASLYLLEIYPNAPLRDEMARAGWSVAPDDDAAAMYLEGLARLDRAGFEQYEISNVARPAARRSRHNLKYWQEGEWLGFGCGAHATFRGERWRTVSCDDRLHRSRGGRAGCSPRSPDARRRRTARRSAVHGAATDRRSGPRHAVHVVTVLISGRVTVKT